MSEPEQLTEAMTPDQRGAWLDHAAGCVTCRAVALVLSHAPAAAPAPRPSEPCIDRYQLGAVLGRGAMGVVYAAHDPELDRAVAVKLLHGSVTPERLRREAQALARLSHPNVVQVYDVGDDAGRAFVAMELVDGENLRQWLATPRSVAEVLPVIERAGRGLAAAHAAGLIHRDFKPDNVLIARDGRVLVGDFGLARAVDPLASDHGGAPPVSALAASGELHTATGAAVGTPAYMAPEQAAGESTQASDQYAFCVTAWEACFGRRPITGATVAELRANARAGRIDRPAGREVPRPVEAALRRGLSPQASARFPSMAALLQALTPRRRRWPVLVAIALAMVALAAALSFAARTGARGATRSTCAHDADQILSTWSPTIAAEAKAWPADVTRGLARWAAAWRAARIDACHAGLADTASAAARIACLEAARAQFARTVDAVRRAPTANTAASTVDLLPVLSLCTSAPGFHPVNDVFDARGCRCPLSACGADRQCRSVCNAPGYRIGGAVPGVSLPGRQEVSLGITLAGDAMLYLAGEPYRMWFPFVHWRWTCTLGHLFIARRHGDEFVPVDLAPQIDRRTTAVPEGCCTIAPDGRSLLALAADRRSFVRLPLGPGERLGPARGAEFANLAAAVLGAQEVRYPVLSADQRTLYYLLLESTPDGEAGPATGAYVATRATVDQPFAVGQRLPGRARSYDYVSGVSADGLSLFMASEYTTRVLVRATTAEPFGDPGALPPRLQGWRTSPVGDCAQLVTTGTPGGCESEDIIYLDAVPR